MARKWKDDEINKYIQSKQISQEDYVAPTVEVYNVNNNNTIKSTEPTIRSVQSTVDSLNSVKQDQNKKANTMDLLNKATYIPKSLSAGALSAVTGFVDAPIQYMQEGSEYNKKLKNDSKVNRGIDTALKTLNAIEPGFLRYDTVKNIANTLNNKDKNIFEKTLNIGLETLPYLTGGSNVANTFKDIGSELENIGAGDKPEQLRKVLETPSNIANEKLQAQSENYGSVLKGSGELAQVIGNMAPSIALSAITKDPTLALAAMGVSVKGQSTTEAERKGASLSEANNIGFAKGATEIATEALTGGLNFFGHGALDDIAEKGINKFIPKNKTLNFIVKKSAGIGGEILEETISDIVGFAIDKSTVEPDAKYTLKDWGKTALMTLLSTGILNAASGSYSKTSYELNAEELNQIAQNKKVQETVNEQIKKIDTSKMNEQEKNNLRQQITSNVLNEIQENINNFIDEGLNNVENSSSMYVKNDINNKVSSLSESEQNINEENSENNNNVLDFENDNNNLQNTNEEFENKNTVENETTTESIINSFQNYIENNNITTPTEEDIKNYIQEVLESKNLSQEQREDLYKQYNDTIKQYLEDNSTPKPINEVEIPTQTQPSISSNTTTKDTIDSYIKQERSKELRKESIKQASNEERIKKSLLTQQRNYEDKGIKSLKEVRSNDITDTINALNLNDKSKKVLINQIDKYGEFSKQVDLVRRGSYPSRDAIIVKKSTPEIYQKLGLKNKPITMTQKHLYSITNAKGKYNNVNYHNIDIDVIKQLPEALERPLNILKSSTRDDSIVVITELADKNDNPLIASIKIDGEGRINEISIDSNVLTSAYGKSNYDDFMKREINKGNLLYDIDEGIKKGNTRDRVQFPMQGNSVENNISQSNENVKSDISNNTNMQNNKKNTINEEKNEIDEILKINEDGTSEILSDKPKILEDVPKDDKKVSLREAWQTAKRAVVDKGEEIYRISKKTKNKTLYHMYDRIGTARGEAQHQIGTAQTNLTGVKYDNFIDENGNKTSMSLDSIWKDANNKGISDKVLNEYLVNYLNIDRLNQGVEQFGNLTAYESQDTINNIEKNYPEIKRIANNIWQYNKNNLQRMVDAGLISKESQQFYNENTPHYVRIQRDINKGSNGVFDNHGNLKVNNQVKNVKGGVKNILPLKESMAQYTIDTTNAIRKNLFGQELAQTLGIGDESNLIALDNDMTINPEILSDDGKGNYTFTIYKNGEAKALPIDKGIYDSLSPNKHYKLETLNAKYGLGKLSSIQRTLLTDKNPLFLATNFFKDIGDAPINSKYGISSFYKNYVRSIKDTLTYGKYTQLYEALGGNQNSYFEQGEFTEKTKGKVGKIVDKVMSPIEKGNEWVERFPRLTEFITTIEQNGYKLDENGNLVKREGRNSKKTPTQVLNEAMYNSAEITTNFKRGGEVSKIANRNGATFLNASIQGFDKQIRNFTELENPKQVAKFISKLVILGIGPALINHLMYKDDDEYENLPDYIKDSYYLFKTGKNNKWIRIPKGRAISVVQSATRRTIEYRNGNKDAFKGLLNHASNSIAPNNPFENNIISPIISVKRNESWNGSKIVSDSIKNETHPEEEYDAKTDELSKWLGKKLGKSPKKINYLIDQYTGVIGDEILPFATKQAEGDSDTIIGKLLLNPLKDKFTTDAVLNSKEVNQFYDAFNKANDDKDWSKSTDEDKLKYKYLYSTMIELGSMNKEIKQIESSDLSDNEKYKQTKEIKKNMNELATETLKKSENIKIYDSYAQIDNKVYKKEYDKDTGGYKYTKVQDKQLQKLKDQGVSLVDYFNEAYEKQKERATK